MAAYHPKKRLGQHFLVSESIVNRIIDLVDPSNDKTIIEIGPGRGALTGPLAKSGADFIAIEFDSDVIGYLKKLLSPYPNARLLNLDFLLFEPGSDHFTTFTLVGNLPYNITSPVIDWCVRHHRMIDRCVFMVQQEMARRITASPPSKDWSPLAIFTQLWFEVKYCFDVSSEHFRPRPKVTSAVIELVARGSAVLDIPDVFEEVVRQAFAHRRKLLVNNLVPSIIPDSTTASSIWDKLSLDRSVRAEELPTDVFLALTRELISRNIL